MRKASMIFAIVALLLFTGSTAEAQRGGFISGIAPMSNPVAPMLNPVVPFSHAPLSGGFPTQSFVFGPPAQFFGHVPFGSVHHRRPGFGISGVQIYRGGFPTVIFPGTGFVQGPTIIITRPQRFRSGRIFQGRHRGFRR